MPERRGMLFELATGPVPSGASHAERVATLRRLAAAARVPFLARVEALRGHDPSLQVYLQNSLFPLLLVRSTKEVLDELAAAPEVVEATLEVEAELAEMTE